MKINVKFYFVVVLFSLILSGCATGTASSPQKQMTGPQLKSLLEAGKDLKLGGPGHGYHGELTLNQDGTGKGQAIADSGEKFIIEGTWEIVGDEFCRTWKDMDDGKTVCERWILIKENKVEVHTSAGKIGVNSW
jgi:hypothetical protein